MNKPMILIVEDDAAVRNLISTTLKMQNYKFHVATTGSQALLEQYQINQILCYWIWGFLIWMG